MPAELACFEQHCRARFPIDEVIYNCPDCGGLLEVVFAATHGGNGDVEEDLARRAACRNDALDQSGVWRYRELLPFDGHHHQVVSLREGNTPLVGRAAGRAIRRTGSPDFQASGLQPHRIVQRQRHDVRRRRRPFGWACQRVACVSTGNTSASMAAYASAAGLHPIVFIPHGNISYGKLAQALEYGARTFQVDANFDQILALVRVLAERLGIYLLNSINPFRIEGQKTIIFEMLDQRDWNPAGLDCAARRQSRQYLGVRKSAARIVPVRLHSQAPAPGGDPGRRLRAVLPVHEDEGRIPTRSSIRDTLATAIRIGDPVSWPKALHEVTVTNGTWRT